MSVSKLNACGILGGTFDPVHLGHVALAEAALRGLPLSEILWMPSGSPGHRAAPIADAGQRLAMLRLATDGNPRFRIDDTELATNEPTYPVHTLTRLRAQLGGEQPLVLLLGADSFASLPTWLRWRELFELAHIAVANRPGHHLGDEAPAELATQIAGRCGQREHLGERAAGKIVGFDMPQLDISASAIRAGLAAGQSTRQFLPAAVLAYIESHHLYEKESHRR